MIMRRKTKRPVQFEVTGHARVAVAAWIEKAELRSEEYLFGSRFSRSPHISTRQYARKVHQWVAAPRQCAVTPSRASFDFDDHHAKRIGRT
jgi:hypothetical protein